MRLFKEVNWGLQEINRYQSKYGLHISRPYLEKVLKESLIYRDSDIILNMQRYGFVNNEIDGIKITEKGERMISLATERYELSSKQKIFVSNIYIRENGSKAKEWFKYFSVEKMYINRSLIDLSYQQFTENMLGLNVARQENNLIILDSNYKDYILNEKRMTEEELFVTLERNKQLGEIAEEIALKFERKRLTLAGRSDLASRVKLISKSNVTAGYDIKSFQDADSEIHDAFIEVKYFNNDHFYMSENELKKAELLRENYYLYLVNTDIGNVQIINDPNINLKNLYKSMDVVCTKYTF